MKITSLEQSVGKKVKCNDGKIREVARLSNWPYGFYYFPDGGTVEEFACTYDFQCLFLGAEVLADKNQIASLEVGFSEATYPILQKPDGSKCIVDFEGKERSVEQELKDNPHAELIKEKIPSDSLPENFKSGNVVSFKTIALSDSKVAELFNSLKALVDQLELVHNHPQFKCVWELNQNRFGIYKGPFYADEFQTAKKLVERLSTPNLTGDGE